jgi:tRNA(fMet)-specific endonuclease VapC
MYLLDTDTLNLFFAGNPKIAVQHARVRSPEIAISIITKIELLQGRFDFLLKAATSVELRRAQQLLDQTEQSLALVNTILPIDDPVANEFDRLRLMKRIRKIGRPDLLIAAIALAHRAILVTRNLKDFRQVPGLRLENWAD